MEIEDVKKVTGTTNAVCPSCGYEDINSWEYNLDDGEITETECPDCGKEFIVRRNVYITYDTELI